MCKFPGIVTYRQGAPIDYVPDAKLFGASLTGSVDPGASAGAVAELFVAPSHGAAGVVEVVLEAITATPATQSCLAIEGRGL
jgi:uncharacterized protein with LGFP repeats